MTFAKQPIFVPLTVCQAARHFHASVEGLWIVKWGCFLSFFQLIMQSVSLASRSKWRLTWIGKRNNNHRHVLEWWFWVGRLLTGRQIRLISFDSIQTLIGFILFFPAIFFSLHAIFFLSIRFSGWESDAFPKWVLKCNSEVITVMCPCDFRLNCEKYYFFG